MAFLVFLSLAYAFSKTSVLVTHPGIIPVYIRPWKFSKADLPQHVKIKNYIQQDSIGLFSHSDFSLWCTKRTFNLEYTVFLVAKGYSASRATARCPVRKYLQFCLYGVS